MRKKWWVVILLCLCCIFCIAACKEEDEEKPWYGTYTGSSQEDVLVVSKDYVNVGKKNYNYTLNGETLEIEGYAQYPVFFNDYTVLSFQMFSFVSDYGNIPVQDGYFSARLMDLTNKVYYIFNTDGSYQYIFETMPSYSERGTYELKNNVLKLSGEYIVSGRTTVEYCLVKSDGYILDCGVYVKDADDYFDSTELDESTVQGNNSTQDSEENSSVSDSSEESSSAHTHVYDIANKDTVYHWTECSCGDTTEKIAHSGDTLGSSGGDRHNSVCSCGFIFPSVICKFEYKRDNTYHWTECTCGNSTEKVSHSFNLLKYIGDGMHSSECVCGLEGSSESCDLKYIQSDRYHFMECSCGNKTEQVSHSPSGLIVPESYSYYHREVCVCGWRVSSQDCTFNIADKDDTYHWNACICGNTSNKVAHSYTINQNEGLQYWKECSCGAQTEKTEGLIGSLVYTVSDDGTYCTVSAPNTEICGHAIIESTYNSIPVTTIARDGFKNCKGLYAVTIPDSVTAINEYAFSNCNRLREVIVPDSVKEIWDGAFKGCTVLQRAQLGKGISRIREQIFSGCYALTEVNIPDGVEIIEEEAFYNSGLISITLGKNVTTIKDNAFHECYKLVEVINKSDLTIRAERSSNYGWIGSYAKQVLTETPTISNFTEQNDYIFYNDNGVYYLLAYAGIKTELVLPNDIDGNDYSIYRYAFYQRDDITSVVISDGVTGIGDRAFYGCDFESIIIPESVLVMGDYVFDSGVGTIYIEAEHEPDGWSYHWDSYVSSANIVWGYKAEE